MTTRAKRTIRALRKNGVHYIFGVPSGNWVDYLEAIRGEKGIDFILVSNEAAGAFMADACWRRTGEVAACFGTFGPGACNLTAGVCCGYLDRSPMIVLTDEMEDARLSRTVQMNIDHQRLFTPITKWTGRLDPEEIEETIARAVWIARSEVPGPVHLGLPCGQGGENSPNGEDVPPLPLEPLPPPDPAELEHLTALFTTARKPILVAGLSAVRWETATLLQRIAEKFGIPVILTPMAKGMLPQAHAACAGVLAHALSDRVARVHAQADLVVGIGYDPVEINYEEWMPPVPLVHIDTVPADIDPGEVTLAADVTGNLTATMEHLLTIERPPTDWDPDSLTSHGEEMAAAFLPAGSTLSPQAVLHHLRRHLPEDGILTCDVGAHLHLAGQQWQTPAPHRLLMTNGGSSMGYAIPAAIGAKLSSPERTVCCITGDGGFLMMAGEMATARRLELPLIFIVMADGHLSLIRHKQENKGFQRHGTLLGEPGLIGADACFGVSVIRAATVGDFTRALETALAADGPVIVEAVVDTTDYDTLILKGNRCKKRSI